LSEMFCAVLCNAVVHSDMHTFMSGFTVNCWFTFAFVCFCVSLISAILFLHCLLRLCQVVFSSVLSQEIGWEEHLQSDLWSGM